MRRSVEERVMLSAVGLLALLGGGALAWQRPIAAEAALTASQAAQLDQVLRRARRIDVNAAAAEELERLPGIGPALAARIVSDREAHGAFGRVEELSRVPGVGPGTVERMRDYIGTREE